MDDKVCALDTAMDDIRGHGVGGDGYNRYMGDVVLVDIIVWMHYTSK